MWKLRIGAVAAAGVVALCASPSAAWAKGPGSGTGNSSASGNPNGSGNSKGTGSSNGTGNSKPTSSTKSHGKGNSQAKSNHSGPGDSNAGDVWVDNVGQPPGPGHEMDPHLACADINLWGSGLADTSGTFTIAGWPPSGHKKSDYSGTWSYKHTPGRKSGSQVIAVISILQLMKGAQANGDTPAKQGYHFKLNLVQDPQKHKTFWVNCKSIPTSSSTTGTSGTSGTSGAAGSNQTSGSRGTSGYPRSGRGVHGSHRRKHRLLSPRRHHNAAKRHVAGVGVTSPAFTG